MWEMVNEMHHLTVNLIVGLIILIIVNGVLDQIDCFFEKNFDWQSLMKDCVKGFLVFICFLATYLVGYINPDLIVISMFEDRDLNLEDAIAIMAISAYFIYAKQIIEKLFAYISGTRPLHKEHCDSDTYINTGNVDEEKEKANKENATKNTPPLT